jgi:energy-converting hydrogenase Eha subunit F
MTTNQPGYRGALPTRNDRLARPWILIVFAIFLAILVLSAFEIPSRFEPEPTPLPVPSLPASSASPSATEAASPGPSGTGEPDASP